MKVVHKYDYSFLSIETLTDGGYEFEDEERSENLEDFYLNSLTPQQKYVANQLNEGYTRKEIADKLGVSLMAIHRIVLRIQKRLKEKCMVDWNNRDKQRKDEGLYKNIVWLIMRVVPDLTPEKLHELWDTHPALSEYTKPTPSKMAQFVREGVSV